MSLLHPGYAYYSVLFKFRRGIEGRRRIPPRQWRARAKTKLWLREAPHTSSIWPPSRHIFHDHLESICARARRRTGAA
jgi:hypothetical protein